MPTYVRASIPVSLRESVRCSSRSTLKRIDRCAYSESEPEASVAAVRRKIEELLTQLDAIEAELKTRSPRYAALTQPSPLGLAEIQTSVTDDSTLLLEYSLGEKRSYLWAVTATSFSSYELPSRAVIEAGGATLL